MQCNEAQNGKPSTTITTKKHILGYFWYSS